MPWGLLAPIATVASPVRAIRSSDLPVTPPRRRAVSPIIGGFAGLRPRSQIRQYRAGRRYPPPGVAKSNTLRSGVVSGYLSQHVALRDPLCGLTGPSLELVPEVPLASGRG